jgi:hypothetical protein
LIFLIQTNDGAAFHKLESTRLGNGGGLAAAYGPNRRLRSATLFMRCIAIFFAFLISTSASAWNPFSNEEFTDVALSKLELQKVKINAGWSKDDDQTLIFEVSNGLNGPIQCGAANVELNTGKSVAKVFVPKFAIPGQATRNASMPVVKGTMKAYALTCSCFKKKGVEACVNPLAR